MPAPDPALSLRELSHPSPPTMLLLPPIHNSNTYGDRSQSISKALATYQHLIGALTNQKYH